MKQTQQELDAYEQQIAITLQNIEREMNRLAAYESTNDLDVQSICHSSKRIHEYCADVLAYREKIQRRKTLRTA
ncbi:MAG: hypothetical protein JJT94_03135 [Bernardetiaceae bacterium]|nr:hypothetical protein [Bernardetiaceae bacterium]